MPQTMLNDMTSSMTAKEESEAQSREFWSTRFCRTYSTFGSEPRSKPIERRLPPGKRQDDGYSQWGLAKTWRQKNTRINSTNARVYLADTYGKLINAVGAPGPGEYEKVSNGFENSSRFEASGKFTVKGRKSQKEEASPTKIPSELLTFDTKKDNLTKKKKNRSAKGTMDYFMCGTKVRGKPIEHLSEDHLREELAKFSAMPGPTDYSGADQPFYAGKVGRRSFNKRSPAWSMKAKEAKPRECVNFRNVFDPLKSKNGAPGVGTYNLSKDVAADAPTAMIDPIHKLAETSSKVSSPVGPGSYDIVLGYNSTTRPNRVAKAYLHADMRAETTGYCPKKTFHD